MGKLNLVVGDKVIVSNRWSYPKIEVVEKVTPTGLIKVKGILYSEYGYERGGSTWNRNSIEPATDDDAEKLECSKFIRLIVMKMNKIESLTFEQAKSIDLILKESEEKEWKK